MSEDIDSEKKFFPCCRVPNCGGILLIKKINDNFSLDYKCSQNKKHNGKNIYFKTFERFYLKENIFDKCYQCSKSFNITNIKYEYKCKKCEKKYCTSCFIKHIHNKNNNNLIINEQLCKIHNKKLIYYCTNCKNYFCKDCKKNKDFKNKKHIIKHLSDLIPSKNAQNNILNKLKIYDELIESLEDWKKILLNKYEYLKENILKEKYFINKMISLFNLDLDLKDYSYYLNFNYLYNYKNKIYENFVEKTFTFDKKTKFLIKYFYNIKNIKKEENIIEEYDYLKMESTKDFDSINIDTIDDEINIGKYSNYEISHFTYDKDLNTINEIGNSRKIIKNKKLSSITKIIKFKKSKYEIKEKENGKGCFVKCIYVGNKFIATINKEEFKEMNEDKEDEVKQYVINIWEKKINENIYLNIKKYKNLNEVYNIIYANNECLISHNYNKIIFYNINDFEIENKIFIECENLKKYDKYLFADFTKGKHIIIGIISIKHKELIQYIEFSDIQNDEIYYTLYNNMIYTLDRDIWNKKYESDNHGDYVVDFDYKFILREYQINEGEIKQLSQYNISEFLDDEEWYEDSKYKAFNDINMNFYKNHLLLYTDNLVYISSETLN